MGKNIIKRNICLIMVLLVSLIVGVGYSTMTNRITISSKPTAISNTWDVHFENIKITSGSVSTKQPTIINATNLNYAVNLEKPGDFYEFVVDVKNSGTVDAKIESIKKTKLTANQKKYLEYIVICDKKDLKAGDIETLKVRVRYKTDIEAEDLPKEKETINLSLNINYIEK